MPLSRRTLLLGAATWAGVGGHALYTRRSSPRGRLRVVSWNLRNFSGKRTATSEHAPGHDLERLAAHLAAMQADVYCFQEVTDPGALPRVLPDFHFEASTHGGAHDQHLVIARAPHVRADPARTDPCTAITPRLRPALLQRVHLGGDPVCVVVVHLKATRDGFATRVAQRDALLAQLRRIPAPRMVVGDFNTTGSGEVSASREIASLTADFAAVGLRRVAPALPCTAYWEGGRYDRFEEPSTLDHVFIDRAPPLAPVVRVATGTHCAEHRCRPLVSSDAYPVLDYERASDHCPLLVDVSG